MTHGLIESEQGTFVIVDLSHNNNEGVVGMKFYKSKYRLYIMTYIAILVSSFLNIFWWDKMCIVDFSLFSHALHGCQIIAIIGSVLAVAFCLTTAILILRTWK